jgi:hypothetical protein
MLRCPWSQVWCWQDTMQRGMLGCDGSRVRLLWSEGVRSPLCLPAAAA